MSAGETRVTKVLRAIVSRRKSLRPRRTQEAVAHEAGLSVRHLQEIEYGTVDPRLGTLLRLADALDTTLQSLLDKSKA